ncbi:hypothetical protein [Sulfitobacter sp.]|uniref:hypothetical protein n=1 Tax=Sulfitobacter sp. TaxID=1903071 RepID=UPI0030010038
MNTKRQPKHSAPAIARAYVVRDGDASDGACCADGADISALVRVTNCNTAIAD